MLLSQSGQTGTFSTFITKNKVGQPGLSVTCTLYGPSGFLVGNDPATEVGGGVYTYQASLQAGLTVVIFDANDPTVDNPQSWDQGMSGLSWIENMDASISSRGSIGYGSPDLVNVARAVWNTEDGLLEGNGNFGHLLYTLFNRPAASDPLMANLPGNYPINSAGAALRRLLFLSTLPAPTSLPIQLETKTIRRGDAYYNAEGQALVWRFGGLSSNLNFGYGTNAYVNLGLANDGGLIFRKQALSVNYDAPTGMVVVTLELADTDTTPLTPGDYVFDIEVVFGDGHRVTIGEGKITVKADVR